jgi:hypothetical protein
VPPIVAALTLTAAVPVDVNVRDFVADVFTATLPNARLVALTARVGTGGFNCRAKVFKRPLAVAVRVTFCAELKEDTFAIKLEVVALAATVTEVGTVTVLLLLERATLIPPAGAAPLSVTVHVTVPAPIIVALLQVREFKATSVEDVPLPWSRTFAIVIAESPVMTLNWPVASVPGLGLKCTLRSMLLPAASVTGSFVCPSTENAASDNFSSETSTGSVPLFETETLVLGELPADTVPKSTESGVACRLAVVAVELTDAPLAGVPPQPDNHKQELAATTTKRHQRLVEKLGRLLEL